MQIYNSDHGQIHQGDCLEIMKSLPENSIETCITDPPAGISFMGKPWDSHRGGRDKWITWAQERFSEVLRILKPGGLAFVWAFPRTAHWPATALENAGFEIINKSYFLFGAGWPKGLDISKGIDKHFGCIREKGELKIGGDGKPYHGKRSSKTCHEGYRRPWMDKPIEEQNCLYETEPVHPLAQLWNGWNSQLKPMCEEWIIGMKPLDGTFVENALKWGVAGYNIGECRIPVDKNERKYDLEPRVQDLDYETTGAFWNKKTHRTYSKSIQNTFQKGRYPGNVAIDDEVAKELDERFGERKSGKLKAGTRNKAESIFKMTDDYKGHEASIGGASRFFTQCNWKPADFYFSGKACQSEKNLGCDKLADKKLNGLNQSPRDYDGKVHGEIKTKNAHPTVKNIQFMRWLCRLSKTPTSGIIIDPFAGTYSTLIAAYLEGRKFIGIELEPEYNETGMARLKEAMGLFF